MTLVELLVVVTVIAILSSLTLSGLLVARGNAQTAKTSSTIRKLNEVILPYYEEYESRVPSLRTGDVTNLLSQPNGRSNLAELRRLALRRLMTMELPERPSDVTASLAKTPYTTKYAGASLYEVPPVARRYNSIIAGKTANNGELLHLMVTRGPVADPDVIAHFRPDEVGDTDKDGLPEFIDGWGKPIQFRRWPTGFASPAQPIDGTRRTIDDWISTSGHRLMPLIFSGGPDRTLDVELMPDLVYADFDFDPFRFDPLAASDTTRSPIRASESQSRVRDEVVLVPVQRPGGGPVTFVAERLDSSGGFPAPTVEAGCTALPDAAFFTVGSERDIGSPDGDTPNGVVESRDNIHNHDLTR
jgi:type II secretory pathway pseudopilin PulG